MGWANVATQGVGTAFNIVQGIQSNRKANEERRKQERLMEQGNEVVNEQEAYFKKNVEPLRAKIIGEASREGLTTAAQRAQDQISAQVGEQRRRLSMRPGGMTADQDLALSLEQTKALARSTQDDGSNRFAMRNQAFAVGSKTPDYVNQRLGLLTGQTNMAMNRERQHTANAAAAWQGVGKGLSGIADELGRLAIGKNETTTTPPNDPTAGADLKAVPGVTQMQIAEAPTPGIQQSVQSVYGINMPEEAQIIHGASTSYLTPIGLRLNNLHATRR